MSIVDSHLFCSKNAHLQQAVAKNLRPLMSYDDHANQFPGGGGFSSLSPSSLAAVEDSLTGKRPDIRFITNNSMYFQPDLEIDNCWNDQVPYIAGLIV